MKDLIYDHKKHIPIQHFHRIGMCFWENELNMP